MPISIYMSSCRSLFKRLHLASVALGATFSAFLLLTAATPAVSQDDMVPRVPAVIVFGNLAYCDVTVDDPHVSGADISARTNVACYRSALAGPRYRADKVRIVSKITAVFPERLEGGTVKECGPGEAYGRYSYSLPCHGQYGGPGLYSGIGTATVTIAGETKSATASNTKYA